MISGTLTPAYGRDYESGEKTLAAWNAGKDFRINCPQGSTYCSVRDYAEYPAGQTLQIRWARLTMVGVIRKQADGSWVGDFEE